MASHFCCTPGPSPAAEPTPRLGVTFLPSLWTLYPVCIMPGLQKTHAHPHSSLCQLCLQSASPNTFLQKTHLPSLSCMFIQELTHLSLLYSHMVSTRWEAAVTSPAAAGPIPGLCLSWPLCPTPTSKRPRHFPEQELFAFLDYLSLQNFFRVLNGSFIAVTACLFFWNVFKCLKLAYEMQSI